MSEQNDSQPSYEVGRGRPPKHTQFTKGTSGNPKGRGKGVKNFATELLEELAIRVPIAENGRHRKITKRKAVAKQVVNKAASGDLKAIPVLLNELRPLESRSAAGPGPEVLCRPEDQLVMANIVKRIREAEISTPESQLETGLTNRATGASPLPTEDS